MKKSAEFSRLEAVKARLASRNIGEVDATSRIKDVIDTFKDAHVDAALAAADGLRAASALLDTERDFAETPFTRKFNGACGKGSCGPFEVTAAWCFCSTKRNSLYMSVAFCDSDLGLKGSVSANILNGGAAATLCKALRDKGCATDGVIEALGAAVESAAADMGAKMESLKAALDDMAGTKLEGTVVERCRRLKEMGLDIFTHRAAEVDPAVERELAALADIGERNAARLQQAAEVLDFFMPPSGVAPEAYLAGRGLYVHVYDPGDVEASISMRPGSPTVMVKIDDGFGEETRIPVREGGASAKGGAALKRFLSSHCVSDEAVEGLAATLRSLGTKISDAADKACEVAASLLETAASELGVDASPEAVRRALDARNMPAAEAESLAFNAFLPFEKEWKPLLEEAARALDNVFGLTAAGGDDYYYDEPRDVVRVEGACGRYKATMEFSIGKADRYLPNASFVTVEDTLLHITRTVDNVNLCTRYGADELCRALRSRGLANADAIGAVGAAVGKVEDAVGSLVDAAGSGLAATVGVKLEGSAWERCHTLANIEDDPFEERAERLYPEAERILERFEAVVEDGLDRVRFADAVFGVFGVPADMRYYFEGDGELIIELDCKGCNFVLSLTSFLDDSKLYIGGSADFEMYGVDLSDARGEVKMLLADHAMSDKDADDFLKVLAAALDKFNSVAGEMHAKAVSLLDGAERLLP